MIQHPEKGVICINLLWDPEAARLVDKHEFDSIAAYSAWEAFETARIQIVSIRPTRCR